MLPVTRADWRENERLLHDTFHGPTSPFECEKKVLRNNVTWLLERLYEPDAELGACFRPRYLSHLGISQTAIGKEPINWGDLGMAWVASQSDGWMVTLEEAKPGACPALCDYVRLWLQAWGWPGVVVVTRW